MSPQKKGYSRKTTTILIDIKDETIVSFMIQQVNSRPSTLPVYRLLSRFRNNGGTESSTPAVRA